MSPSNRSSEIEIGDGVSVEIELRHDIEYWDDGELKTAPPQLTMRVLSPFHETAIVLDASQARYIGECLRRAAILLDGEEVSA